MYFYRSLVSVSLNFEFFKFSFLQVIFLKTTGWIAPVQCSVKSPSIEILWGNRIITFQLTYLDLWLESWEFLTCVFFVLKYWTLVFEYRPSSAHSTARGSRDLWQSKCVLFHRLSNFNLSVKMNVFLFGSFSEVVFREDGMLYCRHPVLNKKSAF